jgi:hypothetical protein
MSICILCSPPPPNKSTIEFQKSSILPMVSAVLVIPFMTAPTYGILEAINNKSKLPSKLW